MNRYIILCLALAALLCGCKTQNEFDATGTFEAESVTISAETSGRILEFDVREGESVRAGESVCVIDSAAFVLQRRTLAAQQKALLAGKPDTQKQLGSLREQISKQQREVERLKSLVGAGAATSKQLDDATAGLRVLQSQYDATLSSLQGSNAGVDGNVAVITTQMEQADYNIDKCRVTAPVGGTVLTKYMQAGEYAVPGKPLLKIADLEQMYLRAYFTSDQLSRIGIGQKVKVIADFGGEETYSYEGTVSWIASESEFTPKSIQTKNSRANLVYAVKIAVKNDGRLKGGVYGEVIL
jgi:HlyD family secretion protein